MKYERKMWFLVFRPITVFTIVALTSVTGVADDELEKTASWRVPSLEEMNRAFTGWLDEIESDAETKTEVFRVLKERMESESQVDRLDAVLQTIEVIRPEMGSYLEQAQMRREKLERPDFSKTLEDVNESDFVKDHVRLLYGRWLAQNEMLDESLAELNRLDISRVLDPATLLFYRAILQHQLLQKDACVETIKLLLENEEELPRRFSTLGRLMAADIQPLEKDSLDEVSRLMKDIRRRQALYRSGQRVRDQEQEVINKLDKLIEAIEKQRQSQQQQQSGNTQSSQPMQDSQNAGGQGTGDVVGKQQLDGGDWGSLPPSERAAAMAEMAKDLPPHYRAVIEEYFRKLAGDDQ